MITASAVTMRFGKRVLFENVSVKFRPGHRYGLIGANGSGKSTFMKIMTGQAEATSGHISIDQGCTLGYLKQDHYEYDNETVLNTVIMGNEKLWALHMEREDLYTKEELNADEEERVGTIEDRFGEAGGYEMESDAGKLLSGLGIPEDCHEGLMSELTGGLKLRVLLAQVLFANPDILLMDEPTNHLDMENIEWLVGFLSRHEGTVVVISHDRHFLNSVCTDVADLDYQAIRLFTGNYDEFMIANQAVLERSRKENAKKEKRIAELKDFINRFSANASKARQATSRQKELDKIQVDKMKPSSRVSPFIRFEPANRLGEKVLEGTISKSYDEQLFKDFEFTFANDEKIGIIGTNGVGKTTLLKILTKKIESDGGKLITGETVDFGYFPQDNSDLFDSNHRAIDWLARFAPDPEITETELRSFMGKLLFRGDEALKPVNVLSGGEKARMVVARMMMEGGNVLVLDEPTNHLDLESIESLNYALTLFPQTVLFVSHDKEFVRSLATRIIEIRDGEITDYPGTLEEFEDWKKRNRKAKKKGK